MEILSTSGRVWTILVLGGAIWCGHYSAGYLAKHLNVDKKAEDVFFYALLAGVIGARLGYIALHMQEWSGGVLDILAPGPYSMSLPIGMATSIIAFLWLTRGEGRREQREQYGRVVGTGGLLFMAIAVWSMHNNPILNPAPGNLPVIIWSTTQSAVFIAGAILTLRTVREEANAYHWPIIFFSGTMLGFWLGLLII